MADPEGEHCTDLSDVSGHSQSVKAVEDQSMLVISTGTSADEPEDVLMTVRTLKDHASFSYFVVELERRARTIRENLRDTLTVNQD